MMRSMVYTPQDAERDARIRAIEATRPTGVRTQVVTPEDIERQRKIREIRNEGIVPSKHNGSHWGLLKRIQDVQGKHLMKK